MPAPAAQNATLASSFRSVTDMWHHRVQSTPQMEAMFYRDHGEWLPITWGQAGERAKDIANALLKHDLKPEERCCIVADTSVDWILADMGILCAGGATTTLYSSSVDEECEYIINNCEAVLAFCGTDHEVAKLVASRKKLPTLKQVVVFDGTPSQDGWVMTLREFEEEGRAFGAQHPRACSRVAKAIDSDRLATLMYTSGTTGQPKGVMLTHDAWVYMAEAIDQLGLTTPADKHFLFLPLFHVFAKVMQVIFIRLGIPTYINGDTEVLVDCLVETNPTWMGAVPRVFETLYNHILIEAEASGRARYALFQWAVSVGRQVSQLRQSGKEPHGLLKIKFKAADRLVFRKVKRLFGGNLRFLISGGAPLAKEIAEFLHSCDILVLEGYGLTESAAASCMNTFDNFRFGTVGHPVPGCELKIADDGEILLRSRGIMKGYYKDPELTSQVITEDNWLLTGDIGVVHPTGHLQITDRKKDLIVTAGGKNIAPAHFENLLKAQSQYISQVIMHGDRRNFCSALVSICPETVEKWARENEIAFTNFADLTTKQEVRELIKAEIDTVNRRLPSYETVKKFSILPQDPSVENGLLTPTMKVKRRLVEKKYRHILDAFYKGAKRNLRF
ncbi:MAG: long-chain fatty acid--CoA ligase [Proteobacteria bacterium]|nr:long-chain fatty acid--CoA ligase [Pseudomonadota bacterium]